MKRAHVYVLLVVLCMILFVQTLQNFILMNAMYATKSHLLHIAMNVLVNTNSRKYGLICRHRHEKSNSLT